MDSVDANLSDDEMTQFQEEIQSLCEMFVYRLLSQDDSRGIITKSNTEWTRLMLMGDILSTEEQLSNARKKRRVETGR
jgi:hypothetical protein